MATTTGYVSYPNRDRLAAREFVTYYSNGVRKPNCLPASGFQPSRLGSLRHADGQALAGSGALVFEGEVLDPSIRRN